VKIVFGQKFLRNMKSVFFYCIYTGCFTTCGNYCRRWFHRSLW